MKSSSDRDLGSAWANFMREYVRRSGEPQVAEQVVARLVAVPVLQNLKETVAMVSEFGCAWAVPEADL